MYGIMYYFKILEQSSWEINIRVNKFQEFYRSLYSENYENIIELLENRNFNLLKELENISNEI